MAKSLTASAYRQWQAANPSKKPVGRPAKELPKITGDDDIDWEEWQSKLPDLLSDAQPVDTFCWDEDAVTHLMVLCFLNKYRFCGAGRGVCLASGQVYDLAYMNTITGKKWRYSDAKGNLHKVSLQEAFALWGTRLGEHTVELVDRIDLPPHQIKVMKPLPESQYIAPCYNKSVGLPTRGLNFQDYITPQAVEDAQKVCEFIVSRFIDHKSYPNQEYCNQMAERDAMYYMEYIYQAIMHPELKPPCAIACLSLARGTGKSTLTVEIPKILAGRSCAKLVLGNEVTSDGALRFSWVKVTGALFMTYDDFNDPKTSMASIFRGMITADTLFVETKGVQGHSETNLARLFFSSNKREFLRELNDGGDERRFHLFRFPNLVKDDPKALATWKLIQGYVSKVSSDTTLTGCPELQAFRCALLTEFRRRIDAWEAAGNKVSLEVALDTAECRSQRNLGLEHNKVAREAAKLVYDSPDKAFKLGTRELYRQVKLAPGCASLTDKVIAQAMEDSHFFEGKNHHGLTIFRLTPSGLAAISGSSPEEEILTNWDKIQTSKERMEKFASLVQDGKITYEETGDCRYSVQVVGHDMTTYEISLCGNDDKKESNIIRFSGSNPGGVETVFEQTDLTEFLELDA